MPTSLYRCRLPRYVANNFSLLPWRQDTEVTICFEKWECQSISPKTTINILAADDVAACPHWRILHIWRTTWAFLSLSSLSFSFHFLPFPLFLSLSVPFSAETPILNSTICGARHNKPRPLLPPSEWYWLVNVSLRAMAGDNKQIDLWPADPFNRSDPKFNPVVPWSLHTFPENFMQIGPAVFS